MDSSNQVALKGALKDKLLRVYGYGGESLSKEDFLRDSWGAIASFVKYNRTDPLIASAVRQHPDLIPRTYTLLTILYGAYGHEPNIRGILKDFIDMLNKDLVEEELQICEYARQKTEWSFFPGLQKTWGAIREVYGAEPFDLNLLPPTPYHAYAMLVLNRPESIKRNTDTEEMFGKLSTLHNQMMTVVALVQPPKESGAKH